MDVLRWIKEASSLLDLGAIVEVEGFESIDDIEWDEELLGGCCSDK